MRTSKPRLFLLAVALSFGLVEACVLAAIAWNAPLDAARPAPAAVRTTDANDTRPRLLGAPYGALLQNFGPRRHAAAPAEEQPSPVVAIERAAAPEPAAGFPAPLPPARPVELASLGYFGVVAPRPPARPREFAGPATPITLASLAPASDSAAPFPRREDGNFRLGAAAYVRIFKKEGELELWLKRDGRYSLYKTYSICKWSGGLGPKLRSGDYQSPEGFYSVSARQLNPNSAYHRAFDIGFPNAYDRRNGRTGGALMVHGACKSVGCFAMTDKVIEEIYGFVEAALRGGQHDVPVHIFPFRLTEEALAKETKGDWTSLWAVPPERRQWAGFWQNLKEGYDLFERTGEPPTAYACGARYGFQADGSCTRIAGW
ncbi:murein L,D-transpeptidase family protein [Methylosinus sp. Sm6]|uniref:L,D-transpeptidase family protein n=1 Tax=Methylosinus sp. Sm6 TaxID=2866948 RepID=UPI001C99940C|nr:murein L,D-transpeptidase family protein [Methylosinus sp. Sm6]MBY6240291.1 murein L,D-transpeptidase [Methylosinus sp. Sm6]